MEEELELDEARGTILEPELDFELELEEELDLIDARGTKLDVKLELDRELELDDGRRTILEVELELEESPSPVRIPSATAVSLARSSSKRARFKPNGTLWGRWTLAMSLATSSPLTQAT